MERRDMATEKKGDSVNIIGAGTRIEGTMNVPNSVNISGEFIGDLVVSETLTVNRTGVITGTVQAKNAEVWGRIEGDLVCDGRVELGENAVLVGNLTAKELVVQQGAMFDGQSIMSKKPVASPAPVATPVAEPIKA